LSTVHTCDDTPNLRRIPIKHLSHMPHTKSDIQAAKFNLPRRMQLIIRSSEQT